MDTKKLEAVLAKIGANVADFYRESVRAGFMGECDGCKQAFPHDELVAADPAAPDVGLCRGCRAHAA